MLFLRTDVCIAILLVALSFTSFVYIVSSDVSGLAKGITAMLLLLVTGLALRRVTKAEGWTGFLMLRLKEGVGLIGWMKRKFGKFWNLVCDMGLVVGFGLSSKFAFKHIGMRLLAASMAVLLVLVFVIYPYLILITTTIMDLPGADQAVSPDTTMAVISFAAVVIFGLVGIVMVSLLAKALSVLISVVAFLGGNPSALSATAPGVSFIIPGLTIPLLEGIIALFVLLVVHEGSHGIAALLSKVRLKSTGFLLFGFIPVGAFVDIDEKQLKRRKQADKLRVAVAGSAANLLTSIVFFVPAMLLLLYLPAFFDNQLLVTGFTRNVLASGANITAGTIITSVNGVSVSTLADFNTLKLSLQPNTEVQLVTDKGDFTLKTDAKGTLGLLLTQPIKAEFWWAKVIYVTLGLIAVLNFFVAVINLVPMQVFDGYRILHDSVKDKRIVDLISYTVLAALLLNILPWIWH